MESELRHVLERLSGQFDALSSELADASQPSPDWRRPLLHRPAAPAATVAVELPAVTEAPVVASCRQP